MSRQRMQCRGTVQQAIVALFCILAACRQGVVVPEPAAPPFSGITATSSDGTVVQNDPDDWKPLQGVNAWVYPVHPNPCTRDESFEIVFVLTQRDSVIATLNDTPDHVVDVIIQQSVNPGEHRITPFVRNLPPGLYRLYVTVVHATFVASTYGDVQINP